MRRLLVLATSVLAAALLAPPVAAAAPGVAITHRTVPGADGVPLDAKVIEPTGRGDGPFPLLVMPASWATPNIEYVGAAAGMAYDSGYVVVTYTARGFYASGGAVDVGGPADVGDASAVIDWALANTGADPGRIGMGGISYGAGISVLTAAADPRVRAVAAMSGWSDLLASLYPNETVSTQAAEALLAVGHVTGRFGPELRELERAYREDRVEDVLHLGDDRSPLREVDRLNANGTAVLLANAWEDSLFQPGQITDLYRRLTGPKHLLLSPGDHATPDLFGAAGLPNDVWDAARRWFDHHLRGADNGVDTENPVRLAPISGGTWRDHPDWESVTGTVDTRHLTASGLLSDRPQPAWRREVRTGVPTAADSGTIFVNGLLQQFTGIPPLAPVGLLDRAAAGVWQTEPYPTGVTVAGAAALHATVVPRAETTSLVGYLYDVDPAGGGKLITHKPITLRRSTIGEPRAVDLTLEPALWHVPAGHRLALVVDTVDPRYATEPPGPPTTLTTPATLDVPLA
ncbi:CocE/NonD family hydrolase [Saccharopolyspora gregorii]|uniref:CocE/NonD family hydrolase n=1 Tax=Saccharopolyspora gregorii TaxID=33914 RepID=UPI0021AD180D|nr:CocE/NonD family hydrolase [Saccharopolyspora gregorii]